tara:strand:- start:27 stop:710 length:684 start_codon:yes stop_codon:yes gene_type:complete
MNKLSTLLFVTFLSLFYCENSIYGASLDCSKAISDQDKTICKDPTLLKLNRQISEIFQKLDKNGEYYEEIVSSQKTWLSKTPNFVVHDFERQRDFLKFISLFSDCLKINKEFRDCYDNTAKIELQKCMGTLTNYEMNRCMVSFTEALDILERVESEKLVEELKVKDPVSIPFFKKARESWLTYRSSECLLFYNLYRDGTIRSLIYTSCIDEKTLSRLEWVFKGILFN